MKYPSVWDIIRPYWVSEERWAARGLLAFVIALNLGIVYLNVRYNLWSADFYNALEKKDWPAFLTSLKVFSVLAFSLIFAATIRNYFSQLLEIRWRRWITHRFITEWLSGNAFHRIQRDRLTG